MASSNDVTVTGSMITGMSYIPGSFSITSGESSTPPPTFKQDGTTWTITIGADRKSSSGVANGFNSVCGGANHEYAPSGGGGTPSEMNFYFGVDMTIKTDAGSVQVAVYFGQGNYMLTNNWWIGGNGVINYDKPVLLAISNNQVQMTMALSGGTSSFNLSAV
jgi:hypothetical protein